MAVCRCGSGCRAEEREPREVCAEAEKPPASSLAPRARHGRRPAHGGVGAGAVAANEVPPRHPVTRRVRAAAARNPTRASLRRRCALPSRASTRASLGFLHGREWRPPLHPGDQSETHDPHVARSNKRLKRLTLAIASTALLSFGVYLFYNNVIMPTPGRRRTRRFRPRPRLPRFTSAAARARRSRQRRAHTIRSTVVVVRAGVNAQGSGATRADRATAAKRPNGAGTERPRKLHSSAETPTNAAPVGTTRRCCAGPGARGAGECGMLRRRIEQRWQRTRPGPKALPTSRSCSSTRGKTRKPRTPARAVVVDATSRGVAHARRGQLALRDRTGARDAFRQCRAWPRPIPDCRAMTQSLRQSTVRHLSPVEGRSA